MIKIQLRSKVDDAAIRPLRGQLGKEEHHPLLLRGEGDVFKPNGERLFAVRRGSFSEASIARAYAVFHSIRHRKMNNRGAFSGKARSYPVLRDGTRSKTHEAVPVASIVMGFADRYDRIPYCRQTAFVMENPAGWGECLGFIQEAATAFRAVVPERYEAQLQAARITHPAYVIPETPFTTITVNNTHAGGYHKDAGDYQPGFGVMAVLRRGAYKGCFLGFPAFGVAADLHDGDLIFFDPHEVHGNTPFYDAVGPAQEPEKGGYERISVVMYFREKMTECLSPTAEIERAKSLRGTFTLEKE